MRLQLRPGLHQVWRRPDRLQIGLDPRHGLVLDGLTAADEAVIAALTDGSTRRHVVRAAVAAGGTEDGARALVAELHRAGVLAEGPPVRSLLARLPEDVRRRASADAAASGIAEHGRDFWRGLEVRRRSCVAVTGLGRTGLAVALAAGVAGVGRMVLDDGDAVQPWDELPGGYGLDHVGVARCDAAREILARACPSTTVAGADERYRERPDLVVVVAHGALDPARVDGLMHDDVPHLPVVWGEASVSVGPLVVPGRSSCLRCQHLHRTDRDPEWPRVVAQVSRSAALPEAEEMSLAALAAALSAGQLLAHLDGAEPVARNTAMEASLPGRGVSLRAWPPHPSCGCLRLPAVAGWAQAGTMDR